MKRERKEKERGRRRRREKEEKERERERQREKEGDRKRERARERGRGEREVSFGAVSAAARCHRCVCRPPSVSRVSSALHSRKQRGSTFTYRRPDLRHTEFLEESHRERRRKGGKARFVDKKSEFDCGVLFLVTREISARDRTFPSSAARWSAQETHGSRRRIEREKRKSQSPRTKQQCVE